MIDGLKRGKWVAARCLRVPESMDPANPLWGPLQDAIEANVNQAVDEAVRAAIEEAAMIIHAEAGRHALASEAARESVPQDTHKMKKRDAMSEACAMAEELVRALLDDSTRAERGEG